ncbi:MAG: GHMP kinase [Terriglobia bacterium]|jgi:D-glycero-alpha-D-manno-heptose-7-phosphate kinase
MNDNTCKQPQRIINCVAPIRICDNGGWTDTWFAKRGKIFNIGVYPYVEVQVEVFRNDAVDRQITVFAENYGQRFVAKGAESSWDEHPLLQAAIARMKVPTDVALKVSIFSEAPSGASAGTSAAVAVALVGALDRLTQGHLTAHEVAYTAQAIETEMLKLQCGIQDQLCSAYGGLNYIEMFDYPRATVSQIQIPNALWWELERRLVLIYFGKSHSSSSVHEKVIKELEGSGPDCRKLQDLRATAEKSRDAVYAGDFVALGEAMIENTEAQGRLHPDLVSRDARRVIEIAKEHGALGWKVNGAGGEGGSLTILTGTLSHVKRAMIRETEAENRLFKNIPIYLSRYGLRTWDRAADIRGQSAG